MPEALRVGPPAITVDVEDWSQSTWDRSLEISARAADNLRHVLELLDSLGVHATMFVLGKFATAFPEAVRAAAAAGHEIACHGGGHEEIFHQTPEQFREDVKGAKETLEQIVGAPVLGYRAPDFSIVSRTMWALDLLAELGFTYDSSIFPVRRPRYGIPEWPREPQILQFVNGREIAEFPIAVYRSWGRNWPIGGGGYHRLLPGALARWLTRRALRERPFVFYCHPYEFDPQEFASLPYAIPLRVRLHQGLGRGRFEARFVKFIQRFGGQRLIDLYRSRTWATRPVTAA